MNSNMDEGQLRHLFNAACEARNASHSPYSRFAVGAALLAEEGKVYTGCNVENASYGLCICAEQVAITKAVSEGCKAFSSIVVVASPLASPCGACRQIIAEFFLDDGLIVSISADDFESRKSWTMNELLPDRFHGKDLPEK